MDIQAVRLLLAQLLGSSSAAPADLRQATQLAGKTAAGLASEANADYAAGTVPKPVYQSDLAGILSDASFTKVFNHPRYSDLNADVNAQNRQGIGIWAGAFYRDGAITQAEASAIMQLLSATVEDTRSLAVRAGLGAVSEQDIIRALQED